MKHITIFIVIIILLSGCLNQGIQPGDRLDVDGDGVEETTVVATETIYTDARYPVELQQGQRYGVMVEVLKGGPAAVVLYPQQGDTLESTSVAVETAVTARAKTSGVHYVEVGVGNAGDSYQVTVFKVDN